ncbi:RNA polymerase sigma factor [Spirosoma daeguense]
MKHTFTDEELVTQFVEDRETASFNELYQRYNRKVYQSCLRLMGDSEDAQDQMQEVFSKVFSRLSAFRHQARFSTWLFTVTHNHCISVRQRAKRNYQPVDDVREVFADVPDDSISLDERWQAAEEVFSQLSAVNRRLLQERYVSGKEIADMAKEYQIGISAMKMRLKRARDQARALYSEYI